MFEIPYVCYTHSTTWFILIATFQGFSGHVWPEAMELGQGAVGPMGTESCPLRVSSQIIAWNSVQAGYWLRVYGSQGPNLPPSARGLIFKKALALFLEIPECRSPAQSLLLSWPGVQKSLPEDLGKAPPQSHCPGGLRFADNNGFSLLSKNS